MKRIAVGSMNGGSMGSNPGTTLPWIVIVPESPDAGHEILTEDAGRIDTDGQGDSQPVDGNDNPAATG